MLSSQDELNFSPYAELYDKIIPKDNLLRRINENIDFNFILEDPPLFALWIQKMIPFSMASVNPRLSYCNIADSGLYCLFPMITVPYYCLMSVFVF